MFLSLISGSRSSEGSRSGLLAKCFWGGLGRQGQKTTLLAEKSGCLALPPKAAGPTKLLHNFGIPLSSSGILGTRTVRGPCCCSPCGAQAASLLPPQPQQPLPQLSLRANGGALEWRTNRFLVCYRFQIGFNFVDVGGPGGPGRPN